MIVLLNGPLGIGKSTLGGALAESVDHCVFLDGDALCALNLPRDQAYLHDVIELLIEHHARHGFRHFVVDHLWTTDAELSDLRSRLARFGPLRCFLLTLPADENLRRIERRLLTRAPDPDERTFELATNAAERDLLAARADLGEPLDASPPPAELVHALLARLSLA